MSWIPTSILAPLPGRFASASLVECHDTQRGSVEDFMARIYWDRYGANLRSFLPHLLAYHDAEGVLLAAVGLRLASEGSLFVENYLGSPAEAVMSSRQIANVSRAEIAEVGNFAAATPGAARELILQLTWTLHSARIRWVLFAATRQLRNSFDRLHLSTIELAEARAERLGEDGLQWGSYYDSQPKVVCGDVVAGHAYLQRQMKIEPTEVPLDGSVLAMACGL
ncbi:MAG: thermostable hemolysin [Pseudoxanthomonas sp.]